MLLMKILSGSRLYRTAKMIPRILKGFVIYGGHLVSFFNLPLDPDLFSEVFQELCEYGILITACKFM